MRKPFVGGLLRLCLDGLGVFAAEPLHATGRVHKALFARKEWVADRADFYVNVALVGRARLKVATAGADNPHRVIVGMDFFLRHLERQTFPAIALPIYCRGNCLDVQSRRRCHIGDHPKDRSRRYKVFRGLGI